MRHSITTNWQAGTNVKPCARGRMKKSSKKNIVWFASGRKRPSGGMHITNDLLVRLNNNEDSAHAELFKATFAELTVFASRMIENENESEDIAISAITKLSLKKFTFNSVEQLKAYLYVTVRNSALNYLRAAEKKFSYDFSEVEDNSDAFNIISDIVAHAGKNASAEAKAAGLSRVYIRNYNQLVKISPDGDEVTITPKIEKSSYYIHYKPSTVLHAVKK